jgi:competence protein ComEA
MHAVPLSRRRAVVGVVIVVGALLVAGRSLTHRGASAAAPAEPVAAIAAARPPKLVVHVVGAVRRPGLYELSEGSRFADAVKRAGGASAKADLALLNLAAPIADGIQVVVPQRAPPGRPPSSSASSSASAGGSSGPVRLSTATVEQLDELPGVGPVTAQRIVDYRDEHGGFASVDDLDAVPGIGPKRLEQLRELVAP